MCRLSGLSRSSLYRKPRRESEWEMNLRSALHTAALDNPFYGYRRLTPELKQRGWEVGERRIRRMMREDNLLRLRKRRTKRTTDSTHGLRVYPNLARGFTPTGPNQLWAADITYIRLGREFVYAAVILDLFSRRVVGWAVGPGLETELPLAALEQALSQRQPKPGLVHHSDQGTQYASNKYVGKLRENQLKISMSRKGNPYDNAFAESFMKTLKTEEVDCNEYQTLAAAQAEIGGFIEAVYNRKRLHSALKYVSPVEFERAFAARKTAA
jgi:transposase InsO family protein